MKRVIALTLALFTILLSAHPQKVGLVLSGGGAKGVAHIGVIKALEDNDIPIDYVVGTSMGAIIGSMYCMGYTTDEMLKLISSEQFRQWYQGESNVEYRYFFKQNDPTPSIVSMQLNFKDSLMFFRPQNTSLIDPLQMNLGFVDIFAGANAACEGDFNKMLVPFRCVGADVFHKKNVVMSSGDLGNSVRASMTFPFVFKPIKINGTLVYDGGIYDNYPYDVMIDEFAPDIIIGSIVAGPDPIPDEDDMYGQLRSMIIQDINFDIPADKGLSISMNLEDVKLLDYQRSVEIMRRGYNYTDEMMDSIMSRVGSRRSKDVVKDRRDAFKARIPELVFRNMVVTGVNQSQAQFIEREFRQELDGSGDFDYEGLKKGYFKLLSDDAIQEIIPTTQFNKADSTYTLCLDVTLNDKPKLHIGGGLSTSATSQLYGGLSYNYVNTYSIESLLEGQVGRTYNNVQLTARIDKARNMSKSLLLRVGFSNFRYYNQKYIFNNSDNPAFNKDNEFFFKAKAALPFMSDRKAEVTVGGAIHSDYYLDDNSYMSDFEYNKSHYNILGVSARFIKNTLNTQQYPTSGHKSIIEGDLYTSREFSKLRGEVAESFVNNNSWLQMTLLIDHYSHISDRFVLGNYVKVYYSSRSFSKNYSATMMQAGRFEPTVNSVFIYNNIFRANQYAAYGIKPIYVFNRFLHLRGEFYGFLPFSPIKCDENRNAYYDDAFSRISYLGEISLVANYNRISANMFVNICGDNYKLEAPSFGVTIGILMPGDRLID